MTFENDHFRISPVAQWVRIHLPMQGTQVRSLAQEDSTCCKATKPVRLYYRSLRAWSLCSATRDSATAHRSWRKPSKVMKTQHSATPNQKNENKVSHLESLKFSCSQGYHCLSSLKTREGLWGT